VLPVVWALSGDPTPELQSYLYQWVNACPHNIYKHAQATQATVMLFDQAKTQMHVLKISDNGHGFAPQSRSLQHIGGLDCIERTVRRMGAL
jgi:signal transduction histidine kinase